MDDFYGFESFFTGVKRKQASEFSVPRGGDPAARKRDCRAGSGHALRRMRTVSDVLHTRRNAFKSAEDFRMHILGQHTPVSQPTPHAL